MARPTKVRTRVRPPLRFNKSDWAAIYDWLGANADGVREEHPESYDLKKLQRIIAKIGANGMAARDRGVAPVRKGKR